MSLDPMLSDTFKYSINTFDGDGSTTSWEINFDGGYIRREHVKAYTTDPDDNNFDQSIEWIGPNTIEIDPAVPDGYLLTVYRDTPKDEPVADFIDGAIINETNLDYVAKQSVFVSAEVMDRLSVIYATANEALSKSNDAIEAAEGITGGDFSQFVQKNLVNIFSASQTFSGGLFSGSVADGRTEWGNDGRFRTYAPGSGTPSAWSAPYTTTDFDISDYALVTSVTAAIVTAANDATTKANAAQAAAAIDATSKVAAEAVIRQEAYDWLYMLATR